MLLLQLTPHIQKEHWLYQPKRNKHWIKCCTFTHQWYKMIKNNVKRTDITLQSSQNLSLTNASRTTIQVKQLEMKVNKQKILITIGFLSRPNNNGFSGGILNFVHIVYSVTPNTVCYFVRRGLWHILPMSKQNRRSNFVEYNAILLLLDKLKQSFLTLHVY
jgi:hypothetical protein